jgi:acetylornithine deacetylase/succinyl-diaminopimelate desuccinylase-like protein
VISDLDIYRAANLLIERHGADAVIEAARMIDRMPDLSDPKGEVIKRAVETLQAPASGAGHDAQILSRRLRSGMMFVPSLKGISHHWAEDTREADIALGAQVFADAAEAILKAE